MRNWPIRRTMLSLCALWLALMAMPGAAQTSRSGDRPSGGSRTSVPATQRDIVTASNVDAFLFGDEWPRADVDVRSDDLTCYRWIESLDYEMPKSATVDITWCLNARNGLVTAVSESRAFPDEITVQGAYCGWNFTLGEMEIDTIICKVMILEAKCGPPKNPCVNDEINLALSGDGGWERLKEWDIEPYSYEAWKAYPLSE